MELTSFFTSGRHRPEMSFKVSFDGEVNQYEIQLLVTDNDELRPISEKAYFWDKENYDRPYEQPLSFGVEAGIGNEHETRLSPIRKGILR